MEDIKPKRTLSEAQRLAFLKGREKRMANIEKKRLEKEEAVMAEQEFKLPEAPPKPKATRKPRVKPEPVPEPESEAKTEPETETDPEPEQAKAVPTLDEDALAEKIAEKLKGAIVPPPITRRKPRKTKVAPVTPEVPPPTNNFSWL